MNAELVSRLIDLNHLFYQTFAGPFSATRQRIQPGVQDILNRLMDGENAAGSLLDLGCGNGEFARRLVRRGFRGSYLGLDFSEGLLEAARHSIDQSPQALVRFETANLASPAWDQAVGTVRFDAALSFAVLHHIPGIELRRQILDRLKDHLVPGGRFYCSVWQFLNSPRLAARVVPWDAIAVDVEDVDAGDYLLDWRAGGSGLRYVHHFSEEEMTDLATAAGFQVLETFLSDGENNRLGLYQVWES